MRNFICITLLVLMFGFCSEANAFILNGRGMVYAGSTANRARYYPYNSIYGNRYQRQRPNYVFTPQQARYYGYRPYGYGEGYNNPYYYNRYRK